MLRQKKCEHNFWILYLTRRPVVLRICKCILKENTVTCRLQLMYYLLIVSDAPRLTALLDCDTLQIIGFLSRVYLNLKYFVALHMCIQITYVSAL